VGCVLSSASSSLAASSAVILPSKFTAKLFEKLHLKKEIFLVTSAYHMKRSIKLFKYFGFKLIPKPGPNNLVSLGVLVEGYFLFHDKNLAGLINGKAYAIFRFTLEGLQERRGCAFSTH
jgi:uncharacterized SAM-binding protein YcdF (DUF218 family)